MFPSLPRHLLVEEEKGKEVPMPTQREMQFD